MKHLTIIIAALLLLSATLSAAENPVDKGSLIVAGNAFFMSQSGEAFENADGDGVTWFTVAPNLGYFIAPGFAIGINADFSTVSQGDVTLTDLTFGPRLGYYFYTNKERPEARGAIVPFVAGFFNYGTEKFEADGFEESTTITQFGGEAGVIIMVSNAVGINFEAMVSSTSFNWDDDLFPDIDNSTGTTFQIGAGITTFVY